MIPNALCFQLNFTDFRAFPLGNSEPPQSLESRNLLERWFWSRSGNGSWSWFRGINFFVVLDFFWSVLETITTYGPKRAIELLKSLQNHWKSRQFLQKHSNSFKKRRKARVRFRKSSRALLSVEGRFSRTASQNHFQNSQFYCNGFTPQIWRKWFSICLSVKRLRSKKPFAWRKKSFKVSLRLDSKPLRRTPYRLASGDPNNCHETSDMVIELIHCKTLTRWTNFLSLDLRSISFRNAFSAYEEQITNHSVHSTVEVNTQVRECLWGLHVWPANTSGISTVTPKTP